MPKLTVYVPDGLAERVRELNPEVNMSQLLQGALQAEVRRLEAQQGAVAAVRQKVNMAAMRAKVQAARAAEAQAYEAARQAGYQWVLSHAEVLPWEIFDQMFDYDWSPNMLAVIRHEVLGDLHEIAVAHQDLQGFVWRGAAAAFHDVWVTVNTDVDAAAE